MLEQQDQTFIQETIKEAIRPVREEISQVREEVKKTESNIIQAVGTIVEENILPQFESIRAEMTTMVTRDYLDDKLADLRGDLVVLMRKEDTKLRELINVLREKNILADPDLKRILSLEPFPQLFPQ